MPQINDLTGRKFSKLTVLGFAGKQKKRTMWLCRCDCGKTLIVRGSALTTGNTTSCGCKNKERCSNLNKTHGESNSRLYRIWTGIKSRCYDTRVKIYKHYGGRGIIMCDEWKNSYKAFRDWALLNGYSDILSLDRIDNNGNYCPDNCRWATQKEQGRNTRANHIVTCCGASHPIVEWAEITGLRQETIRGRLRRGWSSYDAIHEPLKLKAGATR